MNANSAGKFLLSLLLVTAVQKSVAQTYYLTTSGQANAQLPGNWNTGGIGGGGMAATNFTTSNTVFIIASGISATFDNAIFDAGVTLQVDGTSTIQNGKNLTVNGTIIFTASGSNQMNTGSSGQFVLGSGASLRTANANGITGATASITTGGTVTLNTTANYEFNGASQSTTGMPATVNNLTISGSGIKTLSAAVTATGTTDVNIGTIFSTGAFTFSNNGTANINGSFRIDQGGFGSGTSDFVYGSTATLIFNNSSGSYGVNSGHRYWPSVNGPINVTVNSGGGITMNVSRSITGLFQTSSIVVNGNNLAFNGSNAVCQINAGGSFSAGSPLYTCLSTLRYNTGGTYGRFNEWTTATSGNGYPGNVEITGNTTLNFNNGGTSGSICNNLTITSGSFLYADWGGASASITVGGDVFNAGTLKLGNAIGGDLLIFGSFSNTGSFLANSRAVIFNGSASGKSIGGNLTGGNAFAFLTFNGSGSWSLSNVAEVNNVLTLTNGILTTSTSNLLTMNAGSSTTFTDGSTTSFVNGPMAKAGNSSFTFPVGKSGAGMRAIGISSLSGTLTFTTEFLRAPAPNRGSVGTGITQVSACEYWTLDRTEASGSAAVTLSWNGNSPCNMALYVTDISTLRVSRYNGSQWTDGGNVSSTGNNTAGTITSGSISSFSPFALGSSSASTNPLPVKFADVKATVVRQQVMINWSNLTEQNVEQYIVERSADGNSFSTVATELPVNNSNGKSSYQVTDANPYSGISYYRVVAIENTGKKVYTTVMKVAVNNSSVNFSIYPNPVTGKQLSLYVPQLEGGTYSIQFVNTSGQVIINTIIQHAGGLFSRSFELPSAAARGIYYLSINGNTQTYNKQLLVQ